MAMPNLVQDIITPETGASAILGLTGLWIFFKKTMVKSAVEDTNLSGSKAYGEVIDTLRQEVARLSDVNSKLSQALTDLQTENMRLNHEISKLHQTVNSMKDRLGILALRETDLPHHPTVGTDRRKA